MGFGNFSIEDYQTIDTVRIVYGVNFADTALKLASFPFQIGNTGKKNAEDVNLLIEYPKMAHIGITDSLINETGNVLTDSKRVTSSQVDFDIVNHKIAQINPGLKITVEEPLVMHKTELSSNFITADGYKYPYLLKYSFIFSVTLLGKDLPTTKKIFSVACFDNSDLDKLIIDYTNKVKREKEKKDYCFFIIPEKTTSLIQNKYVIDDYKTCDKCLHLAYIDDASPDRDMVVLLYNYTNQLEKIKVFNKENEFIRDIDVNK